MIRRMIADVTSVFSRSGFDSYLSGVQAHDGLVAPLEHEARRDYMAVVRNQSSLPW